MAGVEEIRPRAVGVIGQRLGWARNQRKLKMRDVKQRGGPTISYQSQVETGQRWDVRAKTLESWVTILGVTVEFARGHTPKYTESQDACYGLARGIFELVKQAHSATAWRRMTATKRIQEILQLTACKAHGFTPVVLAWTLGLELQVLEEMIRGNLAVTEYVMRAVCDITTLPIAFMKRGILISANEAERYLPAVALASGKGMTPEQVYDMVRRWDPPPAAPSGGTAGDSRKPTNSL